MQTGIAETFHGLQRDLGQIAYVPFPAVQSEKLFEVARSISLIPSHSLPLAMMMSKSLWENLPSAARDYLTETTGRQMARHIGRALVAMTKEESAHLQRNASSVFELSPRQVDVFRIAAESENQKRWAEMLRSNGIVESEVWITRTRELAQRLFSR